MHQQPCFTLATDKKKNKQEISMKDSHIPKERFIF